MAGEPYDYASGGLAALQSGMQMGLGMRQARAVEKEQAKADVAAQRQQQFLTEFQTAAKGGDNKALLDVLVAYPEQADTVQKVMGIQDTQHAKALGGFASNLSAMIDAGDINGAMGLVAQNEDVIRAQGRDPAQFIQSLRDNPASVKQGAEAMMYATLPYDKQVEFKNKLEDQKIARERIAEQARGHTITQQGQQAVAGRAAAGGAGAQPVAAGDDLHGYSGTGPAFAPGTGWVTLSDGQVVRAENKSQGAGSGKFVFGYDKSGNRFNIPVSSMMTAHGGEGAAGKALMSKDLGLLSDAPDALLGNLTNMVFGGAGEIPKVADWATRLQPEARPLYLAAQRIQGYMRNRGIGDAKARGASGINTKEEIETFFKGMPQLDTSSIRAFRDSLATIKAYVETSNETQRLKLEAEKNKQSGGQSAPPATGNAPPAAIDYLRQNPQFKAAFKAKYGYLPEGM